MCVGAAKGSWRCYKKELVLCQPIEPGNRFQISLLFPFLTLISFLEAAEAIELKFKKKTKSQRHRYSNSAAAPVPSH